MFPPGCITCAPKVDACVASMAACVTRSAAARADSGLLLRSLGAATTSRRSKATATHHPLERYAAPAVHTCHAPRVSCESQVCGAISSQSKHQDHVQEAQAHCRSLPQCNRTAGLCTSRWLQISIQLQSPFNQPWVDYTPAKGCRPASLRAHQQPGARQAQACSQSRSATRGRTPPSRPRRPGQCGLRPLPPARCAPQTACL